MCDERKASRKRFRRTKFLIFLTCRRGSVTIERREGIRRANYIELLERLERLELLFELRHHSLRKQTDISQRHFLRHSSEMEGAGNSREPNFFAPFLNRVHAPFGITGDHEALGQLSSYVSYH